MALRCGVRRFAWGLGRQMVQKPQAVLRPNSRGLPTLKELKISLDNIKQIRKITSSMKMVAVSKLTKVVDIATAARPFFVSTTRLINEYTEKQLEKAKEVGESGTETKSKSRILVPVTTDKGMCGAVNSGIGKKVLSMLNEPDAPPTELSIIGDKGRQYFQRQKSHLINLVVTELGGNKLPSFFELSAVVDAILQNEFDSITFVYNRYINQITYEVTVRHVPSTAEVKAHTNFIGYEFEGDRERILENLWQFNLVSTLFGATMENAASELSARMTAMDNATRNADEMHKILERMFNRKRQAAITTEIIEIISGAQAITEMMEAE